MIRPRIKTDGSKVYDARYGYGGPLRTFDRKKDAEEYVAQQRAEKQKARAGFEAEQPPVTFGALVETYEANFQPGAWRKNMIAYSTKRWADVLVTQIQPQAYGAWLHALPYSGKTKKHILESARQVFNAGVEWGYLRLSPVRPRAFKAPSEERVRPIRPFESWAEVERVCDYLSPISAELIRFACATGVRLPSEAINLRWEDVNVAEKLITIHGTKTANAARTIPLSRGALEALRNLPRSITGRIFDGIDYINWRDTEWREALALAGLERRTPYECRHTFATLALQQGGNVEDVSKVLGHSDISITLRYYRKWTRPMLERLRLVLDTIGEETNDARADELR